jgi:hypothetical protein
MSETLPRSARPTRITSRLLFALYVLYCIEAGIFLVWAPWTTFWERTCVSLPWIEVGRLMLVPWVRGAVTGFGLMHLVWGLHDLERWFAGGSRRRPTPAGAGSRHEQLSP